MCVLGVRLPPSCLFLTYNAVLNCPFPLRFFVISSNLPAVVLIRVFFAFLIQFSVLVVGIRLFITRLSGVIFSSLHRKCDISSTLVTLSWKTGVTIKSCEATFICTKLSEKKKLRSAEVYPSTKTE